ncbi:MAG: site-specific DNA-methyltransferase [Proteobacteria bacterium]|nr:site-specific DNA-methyltransferase [Pseudomonadota bacterium]MBU4356845.1 site-specific DNA-methyltransferase [Pseudomonadota bacterium]
MNAKREEITRFLESDLLPQVQEAFRAYRGQDRAALDTQLQEAIQKAKELEVDPETTKKVKELREKMAAAVDVTALENEVYSDLYNFFRRYYNEGDFLSLRRYKEGVYAIPYEGEEVKLHWANADQYYIKTTEYFRNYTFKLPSGKRVHFKLAEADTERDNNQAQAGNDRRFILSETDPLLEQDGDLIIRFEYRADSGKRKQKELNDRAIEQILHAPSFGDWQAELARLQPTEKNPKRTLLEKHLTDYTARNTFDYFIHKDLGEFLRRELDFFIKNEIIFLDDIEHESAPRVEQYLSKIKVIRGIAHKIIDFLAQTENFQKKLWLKKKFVVETNYCVTLDRVPEELYPEIAANDAQREEWVRLFAIDEIKGNLHSPQYSNPLTAEFLKANPYLVLDTKFYGQDFKDRLLASYEDMDGQIDGLLIHSENFQALNLIRNRYRQQIKCIHIDPPYNTQTSGFLYKNNYQHSSWLAMMENRINVGMALLSSTGSFLCHIDENEYERLYFIMDSFPIPNAGTIVWDKRNPMNAGRGIATQHEYVIWRSWENTPIYLRKKNLISLLKAAADIVRKHGSVSYAAQKEYTAWIANNPNLTGGEKAYRYLDEQGCIYQSVSLRAPEPRSDPKFHIPLIHPVTKKPCPVPPNGFSRTPETLQAMIDRGEIIFGQDEKTQPRQKVTLTGESKRQISSMIADGRKGKAYVDPLGLDFPYCHPVSLYEELIGAATDLSDEIVLDFFAGSGTTAQAVLNLNREDGSRRKYILVEMGDCFDTVQVPRIKKIIYSKDWKDGKPVSREGISHMFKYLRLESYEDALNNLEFRRTTAQQRLLEEAPRFRESYMLSYMLDVERQGSPSFLNIQAFEDPFRYKVNIASGSVGETRPVTVDLVETFNYLLGLTVRHLDHIRGFRVVQGTNPQGEKVLVIWRNLKEKTNTDLEEFFRKQEYNPKDLEFDLIYVNGDNNLENLRRPDETWKVRLIEEEFHRLMFQVEDV